MKKYYEGLGALRGIGALAIVAYHMYVLEGYSGMNTLLDQTIGVGGVFVQLFFMLSSFSLMCGYAEQIWNNECDMEKFYRNRFVKLLPVFYGALGMHIILNIYAGVKESLANIIGTASLLFAFMPTHQESVVMAAWALGIEVIFYLIFPAFLVLVKSRKNTILTLCGSILLYWSYTTFYGIGVQYEYINFVRQLIPFVIGAMLYHCIPWLESLSNKRRLILLWIGYAILVINAFLWGNGKQGFVIVLVSFAILILNQIGIKDVIVNNCIFKFGGKISYEIYLFHMVAYRILYYANINNAVKKIEIRELQFLAFLIIEIILTLFICGLFRVAKCFVNKTFLSTVLLKRK